MSRRQFGAGLAAAACTVPVLAQCRSWPQWAARLRTDLDAMARDLTARNGTWQGPARTVKPEELSVNHSAGESATRTIQAAIDTAARQGGGTVLLSKGDYISGTLDLRSNVRLEIAAGARLLASLNLADYPARTAAHPTVMDSNMGVTQSLIFAEGCENVSLAGSGVIDGRGSREHFPGSETVGATPAGRFSSGCSSASAFTSPA